MPMVGRRRIDCVVGPLNTEASTDDLLHDLGCAAVDRLHPRIEVGPRDRVLAHVAVAAMHLQATVDEADLCLAGVPLGNRGLLRGELLVEMQPDELVDHDPYRR